MLLECSVILQRWSFAQVYQCCDTRIQLQHVKEHRRLSEEEPEQTAGLQPFKVCEFKHVCACEAPCHAAYMYAHCVWTDASAFLVCVNVARWHRRVLTLLLWSQVPRVRNSQGPCSLFRGCQGSGYNQQNAQFYVCGSFCRKDLVHFFSF